MEENTEKKRRGSGKNEFIPFYFSDFIKGLEKFWWLIVILVILFGGIRFFLSYKRYKPVYSTSATFTISTSTGNSKSEGGMTSYSFYYDSAMTTQLSSTFPYILQSNILQDAICEELGYDYLPASLSASSVSGSNMFTISCSGSDPQQVYDVILCAIEKCPEAARYVVGKIKFSMITNPYLPTAPSNRYSFVKDAAKYAMIGVFLGLAWILVYCVSRKTIRTKDEISEQLGHEALGVLPRVSFKRYKQEIDRSILWTNPNVGRGFLESLRLLRNTVVHEIRPEEKTIMVTSTAPGEGKTTVVANLALSLTDLGKRVLLIDWDIRNPSILETLGLDPKMMEEKDDDAFFHIFHLKEFGISLLLFSQKKNYWKRMHAEYVKELLDRLRNSFDLILVDTPPCGLVSDTAVIAQSVDVALYVILQDAVRVSRIKAGIETLLESDVRLLGCIFNGAESGLAGYGENYGYSRYGHYGKYGYGYGYGHYGYGYGYGYGENEKKKSSGRRASSGKKS